MNQSVCVCDNCVNQPRNIVCVTNNNEVDDEVMMNEQKIRKVIGWYEKMKKY